MFLGFLLGGGVVILFCFGLVYFPFFFFFPALTDEQQWLVT